MARSKNRYSGILVIGDPHVEGRQPGFRKDDYPQVILGKIQWCLNYAQENRLLPAFLGDFFDKPRDNPTWMLVRLIEMMQNVFSIGIFGNHDCAETTLNDNDSLAILIKAGCLNLVDARHPWRGEINGREVYVGGSSYRARIPDNFQPRNQKTMFDSNPLTIWLTHHDISVPGYDGVARLTPRHLDNIDVLINGHIHRRLDPVQAGNTLWLTPGNISRRSRSDANREHNPSVLRIDISMDEYKINYVEVPHQASDEVFHESVESGESEFEKSEFVQGLAELQARRTESGAGLHQFLRQNLGEFPKPVAHEIKLLAAEVTDCAYDEI